MVWSLFPPVPVAPARQPSGEASERRFSMVWAWGWASRLAAGTLFPAIERDFWSVLHRFPVYIWDVKPRVAIPTGTRKLWAHVGRLEMALGMITSGFSKHWVVQLVIEIGDIKCLKNDHFTFLVPFYCVFIRKIKGQFPGRMLHCQS